MGITAALGPTNTGKTHRAIERMLEHRSGMIGLPLRLLAREVYDKITARIGEDRVALVTGEEKRIPPRPDYWVCTVESMPVSREVDFVAVDEIQLAGHRQRGHVFTDRLLHARGRLETWFMGSESVRPILEELVPTADVHTHPRLSQLRGIGNLSLGALPPRTAVVAFSAEEVYAIAERLRQRRGGAAVVLGALSPRTRNAQVALYQSGEVDYMVATDAIGMGLNMDVDTVAFAGLRKFDGVEVRELEPGELAQIAGRAGRAHNDGQFCCLSPAGPLPSAVVDAIETHHFPVMRRVIWRNSDLDFRTLESLTASLRARPPRRVLEPVRAAEDFSTLVQLSAREDIQALAKGQASVELLWEVCQIPDFRKLLLDGHVELLANIYRQLASPRGRIDPAWMAERIDRIDDVEGDIHTLMTRIAFVRTWTYVSNHRRWIVDAEAWQARTRAVEDRLSDALHERLVARFVEREGARASGRATREQRRARKRTRSTTVQRRRPQLDRAAVAEGPFAKLLELDLRPSAGSDASGAVRDDAWVQALVEAPHERFALREGGWIVDLEDSEDAPELARLGRGVDLLRPEVSLLVGEALGAGARARVQRRLVAWTRDAVTRLLGALRSGAADALSSDARGLVYQLEQGLGTIHRSAAEAQLRRLDGRDRKRLESLGVRVGERLIWAPKLLRAPALRQRAALCSAALPKGVSVPAPPGGAVSFAPNPEVDAGAYTALGYPVLGDRAIRADMIERLLGELARLDGGAGVGLDGREGAKLAGLVGVRREQLEAVVEALGWTRDDDDEARWRAPSPRSRRARRSSQGRRR
ncbi:putative helicase [Plesiocystis pacifica SIR-1]|uniref:Putative helicase n=1 Tax=Plesiocystis pacifica SIR-1 TaxID=391625 RepID=A6GCC2_9BACT|nr:putative helicase [Plesiocystis pacifica SIR-1]